jgi:hypothetical protein
MLGHRWLFADKLALVVGGLCFLFTLLEVEKIKEKKHPQKGSSSGIL